MDNSFVQRPNGGSNDRTSRTSSISFTSAYRGEARHYRTGDFSTEAWPRRRFTNASDMNRVSGEAQGNMEMSSFEGRPKVWAANPSEGKFVDDEDDNPREKIGPMSASFTLVNTILGLGILGLPSVCGSLGLGYYVCFIIFSLILATFCAHLMVQVADVAIGGTFVSLGEAAFGKCGIIFGNLVLLGQGLGVLTAYIVLIKRMGIPLFFGPKPPSTLIMCLVVIGIVFVLLLPLCMLRDLRRLSWSCYFAVAIFATVVCTVAYSTSWQNSATGLDHLTPEEHDLATQPLRIWETSGSLAVVLTRVPACIMAFVCHDAIVPVYDDLEGKSQARMNKVCLASFCMAASLYILCGVCGYIAFRELVINPKLETILDCFPKSVLFYKLERYGMIIAVLLGYPCVHFGCRKAAVYVIWGANGEFTWLRHIMTTLAIVGVTTGLALAVPDLTFALQWAGAVISPSVMYLYPAVCYMGVFKRLPRDRWSWVRLVGAILVTIWWGFVVAICSWNNIAPAPQPEDPNKTA